MKKDIQLVIRTITPQHITSTEEGKVDLSAVPKVRMNHGSGFPCTMTRKVDIALAEPKEELKRDGTTWVKRTESVPEVPANSLRGRFRRLAAKRVFDLIRERDERLSVDAYHVLTCGAATGQPDGAITLADADAGRKHPYFALFGGGPKMFRGNCRVGNGWPVCQATIELGAVPEGLAPSFEGEFTAVRPLVKKDDILLFADANITDTIENYEKAVAEWMDHLGIQKALRDGKDVEEVVKKTGLQGLFGIEEVLPGINFISEISILPTLNDAAKGLLLLVLCDFATDGVFGGKTNMGYGKIAVQALCDGEEVIRSVDGIYEPNTDIEWVESAMDAWAQASLEITAEQIENLSRPAKSWRK